MLRLRRLFHIGRRASWRTILLTDFQEVTGYRVGRIGAQVERTCGCTRVLGRGALGRSLPDRERASVARGVYYHYASLCLSTTDQPARHI